ncbi:MAG: hypothetical protein V4796_31445, partial [Burkholderia cenocepacia]
MTTQITITTPKANRKELAESFGQNQSAVRRLEAMTQDITINLPDAIDSTSTIAQQALALAQALQQVAYVVAAANAEVPNADVLEPGTGLSLVIGTGTITLSLSVPVSVAHGGTGLTTLTQHGVVVGADAAVPNFAVPGTAGQVLTSNGPSADPSFQALPSTVNQILAGTGINVSGSTGNVTVSLQTPVAVSNGGTGAAAAGGTALDNISGFTSTGLLERIGAGAYLLKQNLGRYGGDPVQAVAAYHGGTDQANWGPKTMAYAKRTTGFTPNSYTHGETPNPFGAGGTPTGIQSAPNLYASQQGAPSGAAGIQSVPSLYTPDQQNNSPLIQAFHAYQSGQMSPADKAQFEQDVSNGNIALPPGMNVGAPAQQQQPAEAPVAPAGAIDAFNTGKMPAAEAAQFQKDVQSGAVTLPAGVTLSGPPQATPGREAGIAGRGFIQGAADTIGSVLDKAKGVIDMPAQALASIANGGGAANAIDQAFGTHIAPAATQANLPAATPQAAPNLPSVGPAATDLMNRAGMPTAVTPGEHTLQAAATGAGSLAVPMPGVGLSSIPKMIAAGAVGGAAGEAVHQATGSPILGYAVNLLTTALAPAAASRVVAALAKEVPAAGMAAGAAERAEPAMAAATAPAAEAAAPAAAEAGAAEAAAQRAPQAPAAAPQASAEQAQAAAAAERMPVNEAPAAAGEVAANPAPTAATSAAAPSEGAAATENAPTPAAAQEAANAVNPAASPAAAAARDFMSTDELAAQTRKATGASGAPLGIGKRTAQQTLAEQMAPDPERLAAAERLGIADNLQPDHLTTNQAAIELTQAIKSMPGSIARSEEMQGLQQVGQRAQKIVEDAAGTNDLSELSSSVKSELANTQQQLDQKAESLYGDPAMSIPLQQPLRTSNGAPVLNGQAAQIFFVDGQYSICVTDKRGQVIFQNLNAMNPFGIDGSISITQTGAKCNWNGITGADDTNAINNAFAAAQLLGISVVTAPSNGKSYCPNGIVVPTGICFQSEGFIPSTSGTPSGFQIVVSSGAAVACRLQGNAGLGAAAIKRMSIMRAGAPGANTVGVYVDNGYNPIIEDVAAIGHAIAWVWDGTKGGISCSPLRIFSGDVPDAHVLINAWPELRVAQSRFGTNGLSDVNSNAYVRLSGGGTGPNTVMFDNCQFNQGESGQNVVGTWLDFKNLGTGQGAIVGQFSFAHCHVEQAAHAVQTDASVTILDNLQINDVRFQDNANTAEFWNLNAGTTLQAFKMSDCVSTMKSFTLAPGTQMNGVSVVNVKFFNSFSVTGVSNSVVDFDNCDFNGLTIAGAFARARFSGVLSAGAITNTAAGKIEMDLQGGSDWIAGAAPQLQFGGSSTGITYSQQRSQWRLIGSLSVRADVLPADTTDILAG